MNDTYTVWEEQIINSYHLEPNTVGTLMRLQNLKEETYLKFYYGDMALIIMKRNLNINDNNEIFNIVKDKSNFYKLFKNQNLKTDILTDDDIEHLNYDIVKYIKAVLVSKSNKEKYIIEINQITKGNFNTITNLHHAFRAINELSKISPSFLDEIDKLDEYYEKRLKEMEDLEEYRRLIASEWKKDLISN